jgi:ribosomal-protein-alanine N-acetyltransferase
MQIKTPRMILRNFISTDINDFMEYFSDPEISKLLGGFSSFEKNDTEFIFRANLSNSYCFAVEIDIDDGQKKVIGDVHFGNIVNSYLAHIGYVFNKKFWGRGFAAEAVNAVCKYGFETLDFGRIRALTQISNMRSQRLLERCGFEKEALVYEADFGGRVDDVFYYSRCE